MLSEESIKNFKPLQEFTDVKKALNTFTTYHIKLDMMEKQGLLSNIKWEISLNTGNLNGITLYTNFIHISKKL